MSSSNSYFWDRFINVSVTFIDESNTLTPEERETIKNLPGIATRLSDIHTMLEYNHKQITSITIVTRDTGTVVKWNNKISQVIVTVKANDGSVYVLKAKRKRRAASENMDLGKWVWSKWKKEIAAIEQVNHSQTAVTISKKQSLDKGKKVIIPMSKEKVVNRLANANDIYYEVETILADHWKRMVTPRKSDILTEFGAYIQGSPVAVGVAERIEEIVNEWYDRIRSNIPEWQRTTFKYVRPESWYDPMMIRDSLIEYTRSIDHRIAENQYKAWKRKIEDQIAEWQEWEDRCTRDDRCMSMGWNSHPLKLISEARDIEWDALSALEYGASTMTSKQWKKSAGYPWVQMKKWHVAWHSNIIGKYVQSKFPYSIVSSTAQHFPKPEEMIDEDNWQILPAIRTQATGSGTKSRLVHIVPLHVVCIERAYWHRFWSKWDSDIYYASSNSFEWNCDCDHVIINRSSRENISQWISSEVNDTHRSSVISLDWSRFDQSLSKKLIVDGCIHSLGGQPLHDIYNKQILLRAPWTDIDKQNWRAGLLSGSQLTSIIGSLWNMVMVNTILQDHLGIIDYHGSVQGDDGLLVIPNEYDPKEIVREIAAIANKEFGFTMHPDKVYTWRKGVDRDIQPVAEYLKMYIYSNGSHEMFLGRAINKLFRRERKISTDMNEEEIQYYITKFIEHIKTLTTYDPGLKQLNQVIANKINDPVARMILVTAITEVGQQKESAIRSYVQQLITGDIDVQ